MLPEARAGNVEDKEIPPGNLYVCFLRNKAVPGAGSHVPMQNSAVECFSAKRLSLASFIHFSHLNLSGLDVTYLLLEVHLFSFSLIRQPSRMSCGNALISLKLHLVYFYFLYSFMKPFVDIYCDSSSVRSS